MTRRAFSLGFFSLAAQVVILRELTATFHGGELFIGTALFGWLLAVALGAILWERLLHRIKSRHLFILAVVFLPLEVIGIRLYPFWSGNPLGMADPFHVAAALSAGAAFPLGFISGALFPAISHEGHRPSETINIVYLFEGMGAFCGGLLVALTAGRFISNMGIALGSGILTLALIFHADSRSKMILRFLAALGLLAAIVIFTPRGDYLLDSWRYRPYRVLESFDTPYGHQIIIERDKAITLITDNSLEGTYPERQTAENILIPPLLYKPDAERILYFGRAELGVAQLADSLPDIQIIAIDPRRKLEGALASLPGGDNSLMNIAADPLEYVSDVRTITPIDIVILNPGFPENYKAGRLLSGPFLELIQKTMTPDGILYIPLNYDTDRYISPEKQAILAMIYKTLTKYFPAVEVWPGEMTLFFASTAKIEGLSYDTVLARLERFPFRPQFIAPEYLSDRLGELKWERLKEAVAGESPIHTLERPLLPYLHVRYTAQAMGKKEFLLPIFTQKPWWILAVPVLIMGLFLVTVISGRRHRRFGLFLYLTAGIISLSLELLSFYLYQASAGSLYLEMAALIGAFMLGLGLGAYYSIRLGHVRLEYPSLIILGGTIYFFLHTYDSIPAAAMLYYHMFFLFTTALATGSLFVAATNRYYYGRAHANRGLG